MWGQLPLFTLPRTLTDATVRALATRTVSGWDQAQPVLVALTAERRLTRAWYCRTAKMVRLALAVREADGFATAPETLLRDLPMNGARSAWSCYAPACWPSRNPNTSAGSANPRPPTSPQSRTHGSHHASAATAKPGCPEGGMRDSSATPAGTGGSDNSLGTVRAAAGTGCRCVPANAAPAIPTVMPTAHGLPSGRSRSW